MKVTRFNEARPYVAPNHCEMRSRRLQGFEPGGPQAFWTTRELYVDDPTGTQSRLVQYWDKSRMEINNPTT